MKYNGIKADIKGFYDVNLNFLIINIKNFSKKYDILDIKFSSACSKEIGLYHFALVIFKKNSTKHSKVIKN